MEDFCDHIYDQPTVPRIKGGSIDVMMMMFSIVYFLSSNICLYLVYHNYNKAKQGDPAAVKSALFPVYRHIILLNWFVNSYIGLLLFFYMPPVGGMPVEYAPLYGIMFGVQHALIEGVAYLLTQKGLGSNASRRSALYSFLWGSVSTAVEMVNLSGYGKWRVVIVLLWYFAMLMFYGLLWLAPKEKIFRRPACYFYSKFWFIYRLTIVTLFCFYTAHGRIALFASCINVFVRYFLFALFQPWVVYVTLIADCEWWQGCLLVEDDGDDDDSVSVGRRTTMDGSIATRLQTPAGSNTTSGESNRSNSSASKTPSKRSGTKSVGIQSPMQGLNVNFSAAQSLATTMDVMHSEKGVKLLNFAYIRLNNSQLLGEGSFSRVYRGKYKQSECAVKLIFTGDLTVDEIQRVAAESQILSSLKHPNIIQILGVAVLPPSVCILLELCKYGSLSDVLRKGKAGKSRMLHLVYLDLMSLMVGCCRGLTALHSKGPDFCHRDIKSFNFLVDQQLNAKVADLELGVSQTETARTMDDVLVNWAAPEILSGVQRVKKYSGQPADVYSFALVLWEVVSRQIPYEHYDDERALRQMIINGLRPPIDKYYPGGVNTYAGARTTMTGPTPAPANSSGTQLPDPFFPTWDPRLLDIIQAAWVTDPHARPTMGEMCDVLEAVLASAVTDYIEIDGATSAVDFSAFVNHYSGASDTAAATTSEDAPAATTPRIVMWAVFDGSHPYDNLRCSASFTTAYGPQASLIDMASESSVAAAAENRRLLEQCIFGPHKQRSAQRQQAANRSRNMSETAPSANIWLSSHCVLSLLPMKGSSNTRLEKMSLHSLVVDNVTTATLGEISNIVAAAPPKPVIVCFFSKLVLSLAEALAINDNVTFSPLLESRPVGTGSVGSASKHSDTSALSSAAAAAGQVRGQGSVWNNVLAATGFGPEKVDECVEEEYNIVPAGGDQDHHVALRRPSTNSDNQLSAAATAARRDTFGMFPFRASVQASKPPQPIAKKFHSLSSSKSSGSNRDSSREEC